jgi:ADP-ribose pyrophosphatase
LHLARRGAARAALRGRAVLTAAGQQSRGAPQGDPPPFRPFPVRASERIYDSPWCGLRRDHVELDDGRLQEYHVFEVSDAVCVVPVLPDGSLVLLWQYRHPHGRTHWELPAGRVHDGEPPEAAAERELLEETGFRARRLERLAGFYPTNGISPHYAHLYLAHDCVREREPDPDASERLQPRVWPAALVRARLLRGDFEDGFTALGLFHHFARLDGRGSAAAGGPTSAGGPG